MGGMSCNVYTERSNVYMKECAYEMVDMSSIVYTERINVYTK